MVKSFSCAWSMFTHIGPHQAHVVFWAALWGPRDSLPFLTSCRDLQIQTYVFSVCSRQTSKSWVKFSVSFSFVYPFFTCHPLLAQEWASSFLLLTSPGFMFPALLFVATLRCICHNPGMHCDSLQMAQHCWHYHLHTILSTDSNCPISTWFHSGLVWPL